MHESSLAKQLVAVVLDRVAEHADARVVAVRGWIAETEALDAEALRFNFAAHAQGTPASGAKLTFDVVHVQARCRACGAIYRPEHHVTLCPQCASTEAELLGRTGFGIETIEVATADE